MLNISKPITSGQAQKYHEQEFTNSRENYYSEGDRVPGHWHGNLAGQLDLTGEVQQEHFARLAEGQHPFTGEQLVRHQSARSYLNEHGETVRTMEHRAGWDATFSAPKTVSLTGLVGGDERVRIAHRESVDIALDQLEKYVQARIGGNHPAETTGKWIAAKFEHDSSRPVDGYAAPQIHTHVVFFNMTEGENGQMRAVQPREIYRCQQYATAIYRSELTLRLQQLGYKIEQGPSGAPEIKGYTREYIEASSPRRLQIMAHLEKEGIHGPEAAQIAAHRTREAKLDLSHEEMQRRHQEMAERHGSQPEHVVSEAQARAIEYTQERDADETRKAIGEAITYARDRNFERNAVVHERELLKDALRHSMGDASFEQVQAKFDQGVAHSRFIETEQQPGVPGRSFTTEEMIRLERDNVRFMRAGQERFDELVSDETRRDIQDKYHHLNNGQREAIESTLSSQDRIMGIEGVAGAGKTTSLAAIREAAEREGYKIEGVAPTSRAAQKLEESGIEARTLQYHIVRGRQEDDNQRHLYIVDESSLSGTKQINTFLHQLKDEDRVIFVGDVRQHQAVEAGRPYEQMQEAGMRTARLDEIVRQKDEELKEVVQRLSRGDVRRAIEDMHQQGRVHEVQDRDERLTAIAQDYAERSHGTLVISPDNESRRELNRLIHEEMQQRGHISSEEQSVRTLTAKQELTGADRAWARQYEPGDIVRYSKGSERLGIEAGEYAKVVRVGEENENRITVSREKGSEITYDPQRLRGVTVYREEERKFSEGDRVQMTAPSARLHVANREIGTIEKIEESGNLSIHMDNGRNLHFNIEDHPHLDYGYAVTSHSSQGQTCDRVLVHVDTERGENLVNQRMAYVSISRARFEADIYTDNRLDVARSLDRENSHGAAIANEQTQEHEHGHSREQGQDHEQYGHGSDVGEKIGPQSVGHDAGHQENSEAESYGHSVDGGHGQAVGE